MQISMPFFDSLEPNIGQHLIWDTLETLAPPGEDTPDQQQTRDRAVVAMLESLCPRAPAEAMVAAQIVGLHHMAMGCCRWAMQTDPATTAATRLRRDAVANGREMRAAMRDLYRMQADRAGSGPAAWGAPCPDMPAAAPADVPAEPEQPAAAHGTTIYDLSHRARGQTDWHATRQALRALEARDPGTLTDDELETLLKSQETPENPYDPSWREIKPIPQKPRWEDLTPAERRARYGWRSEEELAADKEADKPDD